MLANPRFRPGVLALAALVLLTARADAALITYSFTATDGAVAGSGTFSYDSNLTALPPSGNTVTYLPSGVQPPVDIAFVSAYGSVESNNNGSVQVGDDVPSAGDFVTISALHRVVGSIYTTNYLYFNDATARALNSTALPTSYDLASYDTAFFSLYDTTANTRRTFRLTSLTASGAVPEPASATLVVIGGLLVVARRRRAAAERRGVGSP